MRYILLRFIQSIKSDGISRTFDKVILKLLEFKRLRVLLQNNRKHKKYFRWRKTQVLNADMLLNQKNTHFSFEPLISIVIPAYNSNVVYLDELIQSIREQTYSYWEVCFADGNSSDLNTINKLKQICSEDRRVHILFLKDNLGISGNTNKAIEQSRGEYIAFSDHDDLWEPDALFEIVRAINQGASDLIYTDEDKINEDTSLFYEPHFKPDYSPDKLRCCNYFCHLMVVSKSILDKVGYLDSRFDGSQDHELALRIIEKTNRIVHIPKVLYHWRQFKASMSKEHEEVCKKRGRLAISEHLKRIGYEGAVTQDFCYRTEYEIDGTELVSLIIFAQHDLNKLIVHLKNIISFTSYKYIEFIIVNHEGKEYKDGSLTIIPEDVSHNIYGNRNIAVRHTKGKYLLFLDDNIEPLSNNWINELIMFAQRENVGVVGSKIFYSDNQHVFSTEYMYVKHKGFINNFQGLSKNDLGYAGWDRIVRDVSAIPILLFMIKKDDYDLIGGFDEALRNAADIDCCLKLLHLGKYNIFTPYAEMRFFTDETEKIDAHSRRVLSEKWSGKFTEKYGCEYIVEK